MYIVNVGTVTVVVGCTQHRKFVCTRLYPTFLSDSKISGKIFSLNGGGGWGGVKQNKLTAVTVAAPEKEEEEEGGGRRLGSSSLYQAQNTDSFNKTLYMIEEEEETYNIYIVYILVDCTFSLRHFAQI